VGQFVCVSHGGLSGSRCDLDSGYYNAMNDQDLLRYSRQILLPDIDVDGQEALARARVLVCGLGGLGSPVAAYLAGAGVGSLVVVDDDVVELSNLPRQILFDQTMLGVSKAAAARARLQLINPGIQITSLDQRLQGDALMAEVTRADVVIDATDNIRSRHRISDACHAAQTPLVTAAAIRLEGQISVYRYDRQRQPCYRCLHPDEGVHESCSESGILGPVVGIMGLLQALETVRILCDFGVGMQSRLMVFDALYMEWRTLNLHARRDCATCAEPE